MKRAAGGVALGSCHEAAAGDWESGSSGKPQTPVLKAVYTSKIRPSSFSFLFSFFLSLSSSSALKIFFFFYSLKKILLLFFFFLFFFFRLILGLGSHSGALVAQWKLCTHSSFFLFLKVNVRGKTEADHRAAILVLDVCLTTSVGWQVCTDSVTENREVG